LIAYHDETNQHIQVQLLKQQTLFDYIDSEEFDKKFPDLNAALQDA